MARARLDPRAEKKLMDYDPEHGESMPDPENDEDNPQAGLGATDGMQSKAKLMDEDEFDMDRREDGLDIRGYALRNRFTKHYRAG